MTVDITPEAVEHLCAIHEGYGQHGTVATLRALYSAIIASQAETAAAWQPIETAPKDALIDIWIASGKRWCDCYYDRICDEWRTSRPSGRLLSVKAQCVSHWMPRPSFPTPIPKGKDHE